MPIYEYQCRKCGAVSSFLEKMNEWHFFGKKCKECGSRRTGKIPSSFSASIPRTHAESLNELNRMGNVNFVPSSPTPSPGNGPPPGGCPYKDPQSE